MNPKRLSSLLLLSFTTALVGACGEEIATVPDKGVFKQDWGKQYYDFGTPPIKYDTGPTCTLGQPNTCSSCTDVCSGPDDTKTVRTCENMACGIACKSDYYDANGKADDGCEAQDDLPIHSTAETAEKLPDVTDEDDDETLTPKKGRMPSDDRKHLEEPYDRSKGVADVYTFKVSDTIWGSVNPTVRLDAAALTGDVTLTISLSFECDTAPKGGPFTASGTTNAGASTKEIELDSIACETSDDSGTVTIEVTKTGGTGHSKKDEEYVLIYHG